MDATQPMGQAGEVWVPLVQLSAREAAPSQQGDRGVRGSGGRGPTGRLNDHAEELDRAVATVTGLVQQAVERAAQGQPDTGWNLDTVQATVGLSFTAEAGVLLAKASTEGSLELTLCFTRAEPAGGRIHPANTPRA